MDRTLIKEEDKKYLISVKEEIEKVVKNQAISGSFFAIQKKLEPIMQYYGITKGCLCNAKGWLRSLEYLLTIINNISIEPPVKRGRKKKLLND